MNKFILLLLAVTAGLWAYIRPDQVETTFVTVKTWLGYPPPPDPAEEVPTPPPGIYYLSERISVMSDSGIRSVAKGTEVRMISQNESTAMVDDGRGKFAVDVYKLSRDMELRTQSHLGSPGVAAAPHDKTSTPTQDSPESANEPRRVLIKRIADVDAQILELMDKMRTLSSSDPIKGISIADRDAAGVIQKKISQLEADRSKLKSDLTKLP